MSKKTYNSGEPSLGLELEEETATEQKDPVTVLGLTLPMTMNGANISVPNCVVNCPNCATSRASQLARTMTSSHFPTLHIIPLARTLGSTILSQNGKQRKKTSKQKD